MDWLINLFTTTDSVAHIALLYSVVIAIGVYLGKIKIGGISLGVTFVLFAGIVAGHFGFTGPTNILTFVQDFDQAHQEGRHKRILKQSVERCHL